MKNQNYINLIVILIFSLFLITGIFIYDDYGISWDEYYNRINGFVSLNLIYKVFSLNAVYPDLVHSTKSFADTAKMYGVIFDLPTAFIEKQFKINDPKNYFLLRHFCNFLIFFISSIFFYLLLRKRFSKKLSIIGLLFLILSPRIFAESFYNMKDLVFLSFFIISLYFAINFLDNLTYKNAFLSSFSCSLVIATKVLGIIVPFIVFIFFILKSLDNKNYFKKNIVKFSFFSLLLISFTTIFWPFLWNDPLSNFLTALISFSSHPWKGSIFYFGEYISALNLPWHYPVVWILITTPIVYLLLFFLGSFLIFRRISARFLKLSGEKEFNDLWRGNKERMDVILFLIFYFSLFLVIELNSTLYGGWRHLYFIYPCLIFISIRGLELISRRISTKYLLLSIAPFLLFLIFWMINNHPFQFVYFNKIAGNKVAKYFELDYWGTSNANVLRYILNNDKRNKVNVYVRSNSPYHFGLFLIDKKKRNRIKFVNNQNDADFLLTNHYYLKDNPIDVNEDLKKEFELFKEFKIDNIIINSIYKIN